MSIMAGNNYTSILTEMVKAAGLKVIQATDRLIMVRMTNEFAGSSSVNSSIALKQLVQELWTIHGEDSWFFEPLRNSDHMYLLLGLLKIDISQSKDIFPVKDGFILQSVESITLSRNCQILSSVDLPDGCPSNLEIGKAFAQMLLYIQNRVEPAYGFYINFVLNKIKESPNAVK